MQFLSIYDALKTIAAVCEGAASITDRQGVRINAFDAEGNELKELRGKTLPIAERAGKSGDIQVGYSQLALGARVWAIPMGEFVIAASNSARVQRERELIEALDKALPFIARVAGGDTALFDREGRGLNYVDSAGNTIQEKLGVISAQAREAVVSQRPVFGQSVRVPGALAVRVPITREYGFGFNNESAVKARRSEDDAQAFQTAKYSLEDILGKSRAINEAKTLCRAAAKASAVLITGETGTGKELFAQAIHNAGDRKSRPFIAINCGAIPPSIIESYLFGYAGGSFTGARREGASGAFEAANTGTIFLDEISEMPLEAQTRLLRVIQEKEVTRVGEFKPIPLDIRVIASSNRDLRQAVAQGRFRQDLYYRVNVFELPIPPLRQRPEDIPLLVSSFIEEYDQQLTKFIQGTDEAVDRLLAEYSWPGNVRELKGCVERAINIVTPDESRLSLGHLPPYLTAGADGEAAEDNPFDLKSQLQRAERAAILRALRHTGNAKKEAAELLGVSPITLWRKLKDYGLE